MSDTMMKRNKPTGAATAPKAKGKAKAKAQRPAPSQRLLPGDFSRWVKQQRETSHYLQLTETEKDVERPRGFFTIPEQLTGEQDMGELDFLVFYFDSREDYEVVRALFEQPSSAALSHPKLDAALLAEVAREYQARRGE